MSLIRLILSLFIGYIIIKMIRTIVDPIFEVKSRKQPQPQPQKKNVETKIEKESTLGEYIEYEEIK